MPEHASTPSVLRPGDRGPAVVELRRLLAGVGMLEPQDAADPSDGCDAFDHGLERAVRGVSGVPRLEHPHSREEASQLHPVSYTHLTLPTKA